MTNTTVRAAIRASLVTLLGFGLMTNVMPAGAASVDAPASASAIAAPSEVRTSVPPVRYWQVQFCDATGERGCFPAVVDAVEGDAFTDACLPGREGTIACWSAAHGPSRGTAPIPLPGLVYGTNRVAPGETVISQDTCWTNVGGRLVTQRFDPIDEGPYVCFEEESAYETRMIRLAAAS